MPISLSHRCRKQVQSPDILELQRITLRTSSRRSICPLKTMIFVLLTGGVSMGDFDFVPEVLKDAGLIYYINSIAVQPGRPTVFCRKGDHFLFGLPGNPVSSFVIFEILVKPFIMRLMGCSAEPPSVILPMGADFQRNQSPRKSFLPSGSLMDNCFQLNIMGPLTSMRIPLQMQLLRWKQVYQS